MTKRDTFLLRIDPRILDSIRVWSSDEMRSINSQIEYMLRECLRQAGRLPNAKTPAGPPINSEAERPNGGDHPMATD